MNKETQQELYESPQVEIYEIKARQVICQSTGGTEQYGDGTWNN